MPTTGAEEVTPRRTTRLDTAASRRLIDTALGLRTGGSIVDRIMSSGPRKKKSNNSSATSKNSATSSSSRQKSKVAVALTRNDQHVKGGHSMDIDDEEGEGIVNSPPSSSTSTQEVDESIDHLNSVLRRYIPISTKGNDDENESDGEDDSDDNNAWQDPMKAFGDIQEARERMMDACRQHEDHMRSEQRRNSEDVEEDDDDDNGGGHANGGGDDSDEFRALYMNIMTTAFAAELDDIRTGRAVAKASGKKSSKRKKVSMMEEGDNMFVDPDHIKDDAAKEEEEEPLVQENIDLEVLVDMLQGGMRSFAAKERKMLIEQSKRKEGRAAAAEEEEGGVLTPHERRRKMLGFR